MAVKAGSPVGPGLGLGSLAGLVQAFPTPSPGPPPAQASSIQQAPAGIAATTPPAGTVQDAVMGSTGGSRFSSCWDAHRGPLPPASFMSASAASPLVNVESGTHATPVKGQLEPATPLEGEATEN
eukprot:2038088-Alexandrium_andersonii.AAC.1